MTKVKGIAASSGIAIAKAYKLDLPDLTVSRDTVEDVAAEAAAFDAKVAETKEEILLIKEAALKNLSAEEAAVFDAHLAILEDPEIETQVKDKINAEKLNAAAALEDVANTFIAIFSSMEDAYFKERAADVKDVSTRLKANLLGKKLPNPALIKDEVVIIANDLTPSDTAQLDKNLVKGFATNIGGRTSHSAILARSMEIPAVVATKTITEEVADGDMIVLDGLTGEVFINPDDATIKEYEAKAAEYAAYKAELKTLVSAESVSTDGHKVLLVANIGSPNDLAAVKENGAEGVGLFRTEFLYMESDELPTEDAQFEVYKTILEGVDGPVVVRTLDIGGDKKLPAMPLPEEMNPFLGVRAIRLCFQREDVFRVQLRALLRASVYGDLHIMFPMVATVQEFRKAKEIVDSVKAELVAEGVEVAKYELGIMIEIPAAAVLSDKLAKEVDFFSIGTNDLTQYTMSVDRGNADVAYLYSTFQPSVLRSIKHIIECGVEAGIPVGMCGEAAADPLMIPLLISFGLTEFSVNPVLVLTARCIISKWTKKDADDLAAKVMALDTEGEIQKLLKESAKE